MSARAPVAVDFFADLSCPWCYVGWAALKRAAAERSDALAVSVAWRSFLLAPDAPAEGVDRVAYLASRYAPEQIGAVQAALEQSAREAGAEINFAEVKRIPNTIDAHRLVHWAAEVERAEAVIDALFRAYFAEGRDIGDAHVLCDIAEQSELERDAVAGWLASDRDRALLAELHNAAVLAGVNAVPVAIFNRKLPVMGAQAPETYAKALDAATA